MIIENFNSLFSIIDRITRLKNDDLDVVNNISTTLKPQEELEFILNAE